MHILSFVLLVLFAFISGLNNKTRVGFAADLGAEKFIDIKCRKAGIAPSACVLVATVRALKYHGGADKSELNHENLDALEKGLPNLLQHLDNLAMYSEFLPSWQ